MQALPELRCTNGFGTACLGMVPGKRETELTACKDMAAEPRRKRHGQANETDVHRACRNKVGRSSIGNSRAFKSTSGQRAGSC
jgi:hypothetical protein